MLKARKSKNTYTHIIGCAIVGALSINFMGDAFAAGLLKVESDGFLRTSEDRPNSSYILTVGPEFKSQGNKLEGEVDVKAMTYLKSANAFTLESKNMYVSTSRKLWEKNQITVGRRQYDWSRFDDEWTFGLWTPRFNWDPLHPEQVGLTGAFYEHNSSVWRVLAYVSPISIPERSYPVRNVNGKIYSDSPYAIPMPEKIMMINNKSVDIYYNIHNPNYKSALFRGAGALNLRYGRENGMWASAGYGIMPVHQVDLAIEASLNLNAPTPRMETDIYPRFPMHHMLTTEAGYKGKNWQAWSSISGEQPLSLDTMPNWISNSTGPALISAAGGELNWQNSLSIYSSYLFVLEDNRGLTGPSSVGSISLDLPSRFPYRRAWIIGGDWDRGSPTTYSVKWTHDAEFVSSLISTDIKYRPRWSPKIYAYERWTFVLGADFIASSTSRGTIGKYRGDDRVRGGVAYAF